MLAVALVGAVADMVAGTVGGAVAGSVVVAAARSLLEECSFRFGIGAVGKATLGTDQ